MNLVTVSHRTWKVPVTILHLHGRVNLGNTTELEQAARLAYEQGDRRFVLDLAEVPSLTSAAIRSILVICRLLSGENKGSNSLKLANLTPQVREVLHIAGLLQELEAFDSLDQAVNSFE